MKKIKLTLKQRRQYLDEAKFDPITLMLRIQNLYWIDLLNSGALKRKKTKK